MYKGRGSANEKMMRGIPARGKVQAKVEREAQLIFVCSQKKSNKGVRRQGKSSKESDNSDVSFEPRTGKSRQV